MRGVPRYNKLALDEEDSEHTEEVYTFSPVKSTPLADQSIRMVAMGTSHAAAILSESLCGASSSSPAPAYSAKCIG